MEGDLWLAVFCSYTKDYSAIEEWLDELETLGPEEALRRARQLVRVSGRRPDAITLGFSPQVLVAALSLLKPGERLVVITSPEVVKGVGPGRLSKRAIDMFSSRLNVKVAPFAPSLKHSPSEVLRALKTVMAEIVEAGARVLDVSGGTQLVPIAALEVGFEALTYAYPSGEALVFYEFKISPRPSLYHVERSVSIYQPDLIYNYADASRELDYVVATSAGIIPVEEVSERGEWIKRIKDVQLWGLPVFWLGRLDKAVPGLICAGAVLDPDELGRRWKQVRRESIASRRAASELFALLNFAPLFLSPEKAHVILDDIKTSCEYGEGEDVIGIAMRHLKRLCDAYKKSLNWRSSHRSVPPSSSPGEETKRFVEIIRGRLGEVIEALIVFPKIFWRRGPPGESWIIKRQVDAISAICKMLGRPRVILISNPSIELQTRFIEEKLKECEFNVTSAVISRDGYAEEKLAAFFKKEGIKGLSVLCAVIDDYPKDMILLVLRALFKLKNRTGLLVLPFVKSMPKQDRTGARMDKMVLLWREGAIRELYLYEIPILRPEEVEELLTKLLVAGEQA